MLNDGLTPAVGEITHLSGRILGPTNERDRIWQEIGDRQRKDSVTIPCVALPGSKAGELTAAFDIVLGTTPEA